MKRLTAILIAAALIFGTAAAETRYAMCGDYANVRAEPAKNGECVGYLDTMDVFETDGTRRNGFIRVFGIGESADAWVFEGFTTDEKPERINERYVCVARKRVACRRWIDGPQIKGKTGWLYNGSNVTVYYRNSQWCVTNRGYIRSEWLEADPE